MFPSRVITRSGCLNETFNTCTARNNCGLSRLYGLQGLKGQDPYPSQQVVPPTGDTGLPDRLYRYLPVNFSPNPLGAKLLVNDFVAYGTNSVYAFERSERTQLLNKVSTAVGTFGVPGWSDLR